MPTGLPYPGLRPFESEESYIFFGREEQTDELLKRLSQTRFLAVVGPSGCGKSSLVRAGMIAGLETGFMATAGTRWRVATLRPGDHPLSHLAAALTKPEALGPKLTGDPHAEEFLHATLARGPLGLVEILRDTPLDDHTNLLILVDQFEELFRYQDGRVSDEAEAFVAVLIASAAQKEVPIYIVITMRSDFLGECARFSGLPEVMNDSQYLTPRPTREQRRAAIEGPARVFGGSVEAELVNAILNDMGSDPDQLPLMQHVLMRMWIQAASRPSQGGALDLSSPRTLSLRGYEAAGGLRHALSNHADEAFNSLSPAQQKIAEVMFRSLADQGRQQLDTRRPARLDAIAAVAGVPPADARKVADVFRAPDCSFITPPAGEPLQDDTRLDISHESLIRQWQRMAEWVKDEAYSAWLYGRLREQANLWRTGKWGLWTTPNLENGLAWKEKSKPTAAWAERYGGDFDLAMTFLDASRRQKAIGRRRVVTGVSVAFVVLAGIAAMAIRQRVVAGRERNQATLRAVLNEAADKIDADPERSLLLALHVADHMHPSAAGELPAEVQTLLHRVLKASRVRLTGVGHASPILDLAYSPNGRRLVVGAAGGQASVVDVRDGHVLVTLDGHTNDVSAVAFSPDGRRVVTGSRDFTAGVWDANSGRQLVRFAAHHETVGRVSFSPDGRWVASASADSTVRVWDPATGEERFSLKGQRGYVWGVAFNPQGDRIATASNDGTVIIWNAKSGQPMDTLFGRAALNSVVFSPDGTRIVAAGQDGTVSIWDAHTYQFLRTVAAHSGGIWDVVFGGDGERIVTASDDGTVRVWNAESGEKVLDLAIDTVEMAAVRAVAISPDGRELAAAGDAGIISFWHLPSGAPARAYLSRPAGFNAIAVSPDGMTIATAGVNYVVELWDADLGTRAGAPLRGHDDAITDVGFSPDGSRIVTASSDGNARIWAARGHAPLRTLTAASGLTAVAFGKDTTRVVTGGVDGRAVVWNALSGDTVITVHHGAPITAVRYSPNGDQLATGGDDGWVKVWDAKRGRFLFRLGDSTNLGRVDAISFSADGRRLATANWDMTIRIWDVASHRSSVTMVGHSGPVLALAFSPDGNRIASGSYDRTARVWDARSGRELLKLSGHTDQVPGVAFTPDGDRLVSASSDGTWRLWDLTDNPEFELGSLSADSREVYQAAFSPDGRRLATVGSDGAVRLWDVASGDSIRSFGFAARTAVAFSPDGARIAASFVGDLELWDVYSGTVRALTDQASRLQRLAFSPDGKRIVTGSEDGAARIWDASSGKQLSHLKGHNDWVFAATFDPSDSSRLATAGRDNKAIIWNAVTGEPVATLFGQQYGVWDVAFVPNGRLLATAGGDGTVKVWDARSGRAIYTLRGHTSVASPNELLALARTRATRSLTPEECRKYLEQTTCPAELIDALIRGTALANAGDTAGAEVIFSAVARHDRELYGSRETSAEYLMAQGEAFASSGDGAAGAASFRAARAVGATHILDPNKAARQLTAGYQAVRAHALARSGHDGASVQRRRLRESLDPVLVLLDQGRRQLERGHIDSAMVSFRAVRELDAERDLGFETQLLAGRAAALARANHDSTGPAIAAYRDAMGLDSQRVSAEQSDVLCRFGTLWGHAQQVMDACDRSLALTGDSASFKESRAIALAVTGHPREAIADLQAFIEWTSDDLERIVRQAWVDSLNAGRNPFPRAVLDELRIIELTHFGSYRAKDLIRGYTAAIHSNPEDPMAHAELARAYAQGDNEAGAIREYAEAERLAYRSRAKARPLALYRGTVTHDSLPNRPAAFEIRFEGAGATGIIVIGPPLHGSGPFNAIWEHDSLIIWSAGVVGDTIRWAADVRGDALSGRYEIASGYASDVGGRWTARRALGTAIKQAIPSNTPASTDARSPLGGVWVGDWTGSGYMFTAQMTLALAADSSVRGSIVWTLKSSPDSSDRERIGLSATEYVVGSYDAARRLLRVAGYGKDDPSKTMGLDRYRLHLSDDGATLSGDTRNHGRWDGRFSATRKP
ncbi:MAG: hypothetical protein DMD40_01135 [Gemmatimonadetes bacterium]|nr:MAG: hypothetical protein DMD40_01135 [Gemmatimonadota bacterium]